MIPVECVARGYLTGSGWLEYQQTRPVCGVALPAGLLDGSRLPEPIFTPATKAALGEHDENVDFARWSRPVGADVGRAAPRADAGGLRAGRRRSPASGGSCWPTPSSSSAATRRHDGAGRRGADPGLLAVLGRRRLGSRAAGWTPTTSSTSATGCCAESGWDRQSDAAAAAAAG